VIRVAAFVIGVILIAVLFGARSSDPSVTDPIRLAMLVRVGAGQAGDADASLADAEDLMRAGTDQARQGMAAIVSGDTDPTAGLTAAASAFEGAAAPIDDAQSNLAALGWTLRAIDPTMTAPELTVGRADVLAISAQWLAAAPQSAALADLRREAERTVSLLGDALAALDADDPEAALAALDEAETAVEPIRVQSDTVPALGVWLETVDALIAAMRDIALAAQAGDQGALEEAQAAYEVAAAEASRADQALTIAIGESAAQIVGPASASSAEALRAVGAARDELAALSILR